ncbi:MAG: DUF4132 domain-containing protein [bacterium]|nr:DUF4132 domain-containing protein [bacterium]
MVDPLTLDLKTLIREDKYIGKIALQLFEPPYTSDRLDLITDFLTGKLVEYNRVNYAQTQILHNNWSDNPKHNIYRLIEILYDHQRLTPDVFREIHLRHYQPMGWKYRFPKWSEHIDEACRNWLLTLYDDFIWAIAHDLSSLHCDILYHAHKFQGSRYLVLATKKLITHQISKLKVSNQYPYNERDTPAHIIALMAETTADDIDSDEKRAMLIQQLRDVVEKNPTIDKIAPFKLLLPVAVHFRDVLCELIGWQDAIPLMRFISDGEASETVDEISPIDYHPHYIPIATVKEMIEKMPKAMLGEVLSLIAKSKANGHERVFLLQAMFGQNRADVIKKFRKHAHLAIKAYGILPLEANETVLERYLTLKQSAKDGQQFGAQRKANHANAVRIGLDHLAQVAGYADANRLEWAMEAQLGDQITTEWAVDDYRIVLEQDGASIELQFYKDGRRFKSAPKAVKSALIYNEATETVKQLRAQISRLRLGLLENLITSGDTLPFDDFATLLRLPIARDLFKGMIWRNDAGEMGLLDVDQMMLVDMTGDKHPIGANVGLIHPYDLFQADKLGAWQRHIIHQRIVQPIKQVFREVYVLTPAEQTTNTYSNRFVGHAVNGAIAAQLLASRGWKIDKGHNHDAVSKRFGHITAFFDFENVWYYMGYSSGNPITTNRIHFAPHKPDNLPRWQRRNDDADWLSLETIPHLIFSEVMRDADLVVSVAGQSGEARLSHEGYEARGQLITTLLDDLGLVGVRVDGHFAYVTGKLANYRVHLGSAVIHIDPGNYLCIVPATWGMTHDKLFLPFVDEKDRKISEVISKILLLLADDKIKDESILRQIRR